MLVPYIEINLELLTFSFGQTASVIAKPCHDYLIVKIQILNHFLRIQIIYKQFYILYVNWCKSITANSCASASFAFFILSYTSRLGFQIVKLCTTCNNWLNISFCVDSSFSL
jgi:hypothetical protein